MELIRFSVNAYGAPFFIHDDMMSSIIYGNFQVFFNHICDFNFFTHTNFSAHISTT